MRLYFHGFIMLIQKFVLRHNTGAVICRFALKMGVVYIKMAQILAMQNYGQIFSEQDRRNLSKVCDDCRPVSYRKITKIIESEYGCKISDKFRSIDPKPIGAASVSQVHRAVLLDGREVAIKVKRQDVARRVRRDVRQIQRLIHRFGKLTKFRNFLGSDQALTLWAEWIYQETDFQRERQNITEYQDFISSVNGKIPHSVRLKVPQVFSELCTDNLIVMEFIHDPTINQLSLTAEHKAKIRDGLNDYMALSFYALLHGLPVIFHGDPHGGNIYLDAAGNVGFLDLGLIFALNSEEVKFVREIFLNAYSGRADKVIETLIRTSECGTFDEAQFRDDIQREVAKIQDIPVAQFFVEMMNIFVYYNISPPEVFFKMAKAFLALFGIGVFSENLSSTKQLLAAQVTEFYVERSFDDFRQICTSGTKLLPGFLATTLRDGPAKALAQEFCLLDEFHAQLETAWQHGAEILEYFR